MIEIESTVNGSPGLATLEACDSALAARLFQRLSAESLYRRFHSPVPRADQFTAQLLRIDHYDREAVAAVAGGELIGVAQYARADGAREADLAIVVADAWQRQGIGTRLIAALAERATVAGITQFAVNVQGDNFAALKLLKRVAPGIRLAFSSGVGEGLIPLT